LVKLAPRVRPKMADREVMRVSMWRMLVVRWGLWRSD
jgi:hypothetical protein